MIPTPKRDNAQRELGKVGKAIKFKPNSNARSTATEAQIDRLRECLRRRDHHTHELRKLGISHPAGRVQDLLKAGCVIESGRTVTVDSDGFTHSGVAIYSLVSEPQGIGAEITSSQTGRIDMTLAGLLAFAGVCIVLLAGWL